MDKRWASAKEEMGEKRVSENEVSIVLNYVRQTLMVEVWGQRRLILKRVMVDGSRMGAGCTEVRRKGRGVTGARGGDARGGSDNVHCVGDRGGVGVRGPGSRVGCAASCMASLCRCVCVVEKDAPVIVLAPLQLHRPRTLAHAVDVGLERLR